MRLSTIQKDRAVGAVLASAVGDALGAPYEFQAPLPSDRDVVLRAGGPWELGEWTDDTAMAVPILRALAEGRRLDDDRTLDRLIAEWSGWRRGAKDVGIQIGRVLGTIRSLTADDARRAARILHEQTGRSAGNGSLMRTGPVALAFLDERPGTVERLASAARSISDLTHFDPEAGDACVLWSLAIRHAILTGELDLGGGLAALPSERRGLWSERIDEAETRMPWDFPKNGWVVQALQAAWSAISHGDSLVQRLVLAVRCGNDTDTVAAIAGALAGAAQGVTAVPFAWRRHLHGWAAADRVGTHRDLQRWAVLAASHGRVDRVGWPAAERFPVGADATLVQHPLDERVWLGDLASLDRLPREVDAVVSLCRVGAAQVRVPASEHHLVWLVDADGENANVDGTLADAADAIAELRREGRTVLVHCFEARSRTAAVAATYAVRHLGVESDRALASVAATLPNYGPQRFLLDAVRRAATAESRR
ncbi:ADP-ribosylglycohydrolase family protein [Agrococcus sp. SGAir0287]|uniref:ADP-ribosylglycohydrolase family protein n=1 Tax=Agrococcus sp. SGAir0287 TaxID=2070347 RepID=UPI0010CD22B2|nr:ADP-ribosylglycohydrolase family protein [Agrococcus sp. SGAir0287]QCR20288.1 ribosylglycohydrolase [Agrococcus sp. SGAir0287]